MGKNGIKQVSNPAASASVHRGYLLVIEDCSLLWRCYQIMWVVYIIAIDNIDLHLEYDASLINPARSVDGG